MVDSSEDSSDDEDDESAGICTIGENVECNGNNTDNSPDEANYKATGGGTFPGLPAHLIHVDANE